ncbi:hypothetical protein [Nocardioides bruguierae]|uniref:hypothetical protein n=1 Tax=Nocardioides bruguierae TaxID=2945102 RepID=UPI0020204C43|nr:hypothetical protein [Nocardioides bruguierae]MCL8026964.1 hypothetical protein [Nocardioides bruguierae]
MDGTKWTMFNVGTDGNGSYVMGLTANDGARIYETEVIGDVIGNVVCGGGVYAAVGIWGNPKKAMGTKLMEYSLANSEISGQVSERLNLPAGSHVVNLACWRGQVVTVAMRRNATIIGVLTGQGERRWRAVRSDLDYDGDDDVVGVRGSNLLTASAYDDVRSLNLRTGGVHLVIPSPSPGDFQAALDRGRLIAWVGDDDGHSYVRWYDVKDGQMLEEISADRVSEFLSSADEGIDSAPVAIP